MRRIKHNFGIKALLKRFCVAFVEGEHAEMHGALHLAVGGYGVWRRGRKRCNAALEIDGDAHLVEKIHAEDSVDFSATCVADGTQVNGGKFEVMKFVFTEGEFRKRDFTGA